MDRLTTDNPQDLFETAMNFAYTKKNRKVYLRIPDNRGKDYELLDFIISKREDNSFYDCLREDFSDGGCIECVADNLVCPYGALYLVATQAADMRTRLKKYEDAEKLKEG